MSRQFCKAARLAEVQKLQMMGYSLIRSLKCAANYEGQLEARRQSADRQKHDHQHRHDKATVFLLADHGSPAYCGLLLLQAGDIEKNPGPTFPCGKCNINVTYKTWSIRCIACLMWHHQKCTSMTVAEIKCMKNKKWTCDKCDYLISNPPQSAESIPKPPVRKKNNRKKTQPGDLKHHSMECRRNFNKAARTESSSRKNISRCSIDPGNTSHWRKTIEGHELPDSTEGQNSTQRKRQSERRRNSDSTQKRH